MLMEGDYASCLTPSGACAILPCMKVLCVGRHALLADHIASLFRDAGADTHAAVGLAEGATLAATMMPDAVLCDYDLLATNSLASWEGDPALATVPVVAVSLNRRPEEACAFDVNGIAGFLYLPTLDRGAALRTLAGLTRRSDAPAALPVHAERHADVPADAGYRRPDAADAPARAG